MTVYVPRSDCQIKDLANIYTKLFGDITDGTFVEVGAYDGVSYSNTVFLAELGWRGLYIEPDIRSFTKCMAAHSDQLNISCANLAMGRRNGELVMFKKHGDYSIGDPAMAAALGAQEDLYTAETTRLDVLLWAAMIHPGFQLLVIDVDGMEMDVLDGFSIDHYKPQMVIIETHQLHPDGRLRVHTDAINAHMAAHNYSPCNVDEINTIFVQTQE